MCVDEEHVRALAYQATEWHKSGIKPVGSAGRLNYGFCFFSELSLLKLIDFQLVATTHIVNKPDLKTMSKNKKKKLKKKEKIKQKMLELTQQQIQVNFFFSLESLLLNILSLFFSLKDAEKQKQNLLASPNQLNFNKMNLNDSFIQTKPGKLIGSIFIVNRIRFASLKIIQRQMPVKEKK